MHLASNAFNNFMKTYTESGLGLGPAEAGRGLAADYNSRQCQRELMNTPGMDSIDLDVLPDDRAALSDTNTTIEQQEQLLIVKARKDKFKKRTPCLRHKTCCPVDRADGKRQNRKLYVTWREEETRLALQEDHVGGHENVKQFGVGSLENEGRKIEEVASLKAEAKTLKAKLPPQLQANVDELSIT